MVSALLHLILPKTRNVQGHGVPHLTSSCSSCCHDNLITGITQQYLSSPPPFFFFFSYTPYLLPSALGFHAKNVTCGTKCSTIQMRAQPWKYEGISHRGITDGRYMFPLLSLRKTILRWSCTVPQRVPARRSPSCPQWPAQCVCLWWLSLLPGFTLPSALLLPEITFPKILLAWVLDLRPAL